MFLQHFALVDTVRKDSNLDKHTHKKKPKQNFVYAPLLYPRNMSSTHQENTG